MPRAVHRAAREKRTGQTAAGAHGGTSPVPLKPHILTFPSGAEQRPHRDEGTRVNPRISSWTNIGPWSTVHPYSSQLWSLCAGPPAVHGRPVAKGIFPVRTRIPVRRGGGPAAVGPHPPGGPLSASPASGFGSNATRQHRSGAAGPERGRERGAPRSPYFRFLIFVISCLIRARVRRGTRHPSIADPRRGPDGTLAQAREVETASAGRVPDRPGFRASSDRDHDV